MAPLVGATGQGDVLEWSAGGAPLPLRLRELDLHLADTLERLHGAPNPALRLATALVSGLTGAGHICVPLADYAGRRIPWEGPLAPPLQMAPPLDAWLDSLRQSRQVGGPGAQTPLVLDPAGRLYLGRYWYLEAQLAARIEALLDAPPMPVDAHLARVRLDQLFPACAQVDWQRVAASLALDGRLTLITGGPGTGKTTTVCKLLILLQEQALTQQGRPLRIELAAPTGKAAGRLGESIAATLQRLAASVPAALLQSIPREARTLHRLLGARPGQVDFRHHAANPLHLDLLLVDEASMVDLALMSRLFAALPHQARVVLLGDRDQLASVEAGGVLGDLCLPSTAGAAFSATRQARLAALGTPLTLPNEVKAPLADHQVRLRHSHRFLPDSPIAALAEAVNAGDGPGVRSALEGAGEGAGLSWRAYDEGSLARLLGERVIPTLAEQVRRRDPLAALEGLEQLRLLCAVREGPGGVVEVNRLVERLLAQQGAIEPQGRWYAGRPILITRNDATLGVANGDVAVLLPEPNRGGRLRAFLRRPEGGVRSLLPERLPSHETLFAMTVHKSQGSEFDHTLLLLPPRDNPLLTRELLYTAITRARRQIEVWGDPALFAAAVTRRVQRHSGLAARLWGDA